ncbi:unnamed protein product [Chrysoparadoxa australica]
MGNSSSAEADASVGFRVLGVQPNSPASSAGLVSFFDFIVAANGVPFTTLDTTFIDMIRASCDKPLPLTIYNYKSKRVRDVTITPSRHWGGQGLLGVTIRFDTYHNAEENLVRVLDTAKNSPAQLAGLQPGEDYLLGTAERVFKDPNILNEELQQHLEQPMEVYVYNTRTDEVRVAVLLPTVSWGEAGCGCLGAEIGHGYLHRLPESCRGSSGTSVGIGVSLTSGSLIQQAGIGTGTVEGNEEVKLIDVNLEAGAGAAVSPR